MKSADYRNIISRISFKLLKKRFPGLENKHLKEVAAQIAINVHARMYGANVDGVDSPIWTSTDKNNDMRNKPNIDASELLKVTE